MKKYIFLFLILSISQELVAQKLWEIKKNSGLGIKLIAPDGNLLIQESTKLTCISNINGSQIWEKKTALDPKIKFIGVNTIALVTFNDVDLINLKDGSDIKLGDQLYTEITTYDEKGLEFIWATNENKTDLFLMNQPTTPLKLISITNSEQILLSTSINENFAHFFTKNGFAKIDLKNLKVVAFIPIIKPKVLSSKMFEKIFENKIVKVGEDDILMHNGHLIKFNQMERLFGTKKSIQLLVILLFIIMKLFTVVKINLLII